MQCSHKTEWEHNFLFVGRYGPIYKSVKVIKIIQFVYYAKKNVYFFLYTAKTTLKVECNESGVCFQCTHLFPFVPSVQFSCSVVSDSLRPHESQYTRPPCPSPTSRAYPNSCPLSQWCHPAISSSVVPFSSCPQSLPASESFPMSQPFAWVAKVLGFQLQHQSFQWTPKTDFL